MNLIKQSFEILESQGTLKDIERAARLCYKSEDKITEDDSSAKKLVSNLISRGHYAMLEFGEDIVLSLDTSEIFNFFFQFKEQPFYKALYFKEKELLETIVSINPRTALEIIKYLEINDAINELESNVHLYNSLLYYLPYKEIIGEHRYAIINEKMVKNSLYVGNLEDIQKITVKFTCPRSISHELVRHKQICVAI